MKERVKGRRYYVADGKRWKFELVSDGIRIRRHKSRRVRTISFGDLLSVVDGQKLLPL